MGKTTLKKGDYKTVLMSALAAADAWFGYNLLAVLIIVIVSLLIFFCSICRRILKPVFLGDIPDSLTIDSNDKYLITI